MSFLEKYKPKSLQDLYGNKMKINKALEWIRNFDNNEKKLLLLSGPPGVGKTSLAHIILKSENYYPIEFNASDVRTSKMIEQKLSKIINHKSIMTMFNQNSKLSIIMDEIDGCLSGDKGGIKQLIKMVTPNNKSKKTKKNIKKKKKIKKQKNSPCKSIQHKIIKLDKTQKEPKFVLKTPIICICNKDTSKNIGELKKISEYIKFTHPSKYQIIEFIKKVCQSENIIMKDYHYKYIFNHSQNDFRRILIILETLKHKYKNESVMKKKFIKNVIKMIDKKTIDLSVNECVSKILYSKEKEDIINYTNKDPFVIPLVIHQNLPRYFQYNLISKDETQNYDDQKLPILKNYYDYLTEYCKLEKYIFQNQEWFFTDYTLYFSSINANLQFSKIPKTIYQTDSKVFFSTLLSKTSLKFLNKKNLKLICNKLDITINDFQFISECILQSLICKSKEEEEEKSIQCENYKKTIEFLKHKEIDKKDFDKFIKLNNHSKYWNKKMNLKTKKKIFNDLFS